MKKIFSVLFILLCLAFLFSCQTIDLYEKIASIPDHSWNSSFKPSFQFSIKDTSVPYQLYIILRHRDKYNYNNIYINLITKKPDEDNTQTVRYDLKLGSDETGWYGSGMDDIYEHRIPLTPPGTPFYFRKPGEYSFTIEHIMREDPLKNVLNVGLRIEKKQP